MVAAAAEAERRGRRGPKASLSLDSRHLSIKEREGLTGFKVGVASPQSREQRQRKSPTS